MIYVFAWLFIGAACSLVFPRWPSPLALMSGPLVLWWELGIQALTFTRMVFLVHGMREPAGTYAYNLKKTYDVWLVAFSPTNLFVLGLWPIIAPLLISGVFFSKDPCKGP
jgi:hypothetical protein